MGEEYKKMYVSNKKQEVSADPLFAFVPNAQEENPDETIATNGSGSKKEADVIEKSVQNEVLEGKVEGGHIFYKTREVAEELHITDQDVRNYAQFFEDILQIEKTASGHRRFSRENIDKLANILRIKQENNYTFEQVRELLRSDEGKIAAAGDDLSRLRELMNWTLSQMGRVVKEEVNEVLSSKEIFLEEKYAKENMLLLQDNESKDKALEETKNELNKIREETETIRNELNAIKVDKEEKDVRIQELLAENERIKRELEEAKNKKWYKFWK